MTSQPINAANAPQPSGGYAQARKGENPLEWLYISGQIPEAPSGEVPTSFDQQARLVWDNVLAQLEAANMAVGDLVKVTTFLSSRDFNDENRVERERALRDHEPALTVIITGIFDESWLLEIEAIAAR